MGHIRILQTRRRCQWVRSVAYAVFCIIVIVGGAVLLGGCATRAPKDDSAYWVPLLAPDGVVHEIEILATDAAKARVIMCVPIDATRFRCLIKQDADGAYGFVTIFLEPDAQEGT